MNKNDKIRLRVLGISYSQIQSGVCALILAEVGGPMRIPVVIGQAEAQSIAIQMEGIKTPRPLTHDLFSSFIHAYGIAMIEAYIYKFEDGVFCAELKFTDGERQIAIDARTSDAVALAMRVHAPIYTTRAILDETGFTMDEHEGEEGPGDEESSDLAADAMMPDPSKYTIEQLRQSLSDCIAREDYEQAALLQQLLDKREKDNENENNK